MIYKKKKKKPPHKLHPNSRENLPNKSVPECGETSLTQLFVKLLHIPHPPHNMLGLLSKAGSHPAKNHGLYSFQIPLIIWKLHLFKKTAGFKVRNDKAQDVQAS